MSISEINDKRQEWSLPLLVQIIWCSEGPCETSNGNEFTDLDPEPLEIEHRGTDFTFTF